MITSERSARPAAALAAQVPRDPTPAYHRIFQTLRRRIATGQIAPGAQLPTEEELMREFAVSRHTVRAALQQLVAQGLVWRRSGKGSFVIDPAEPRERPWAAQSLEDMLDRNFGAEIVAPRMALLPARSAAEAEARRALGTRERIAHFTWTRRSPEGPCSAADVYLPRSNSDPLPKDWPERLSATRLLHLVEVACGIEALRVLQVASAVAAEPAAAARLEVPVGSPLLSLRRTYFDRDGVAIEFSRILGRPDRCEQSVELFRAEL
jgi:GntR family transcriptional regulator